MLPKEEYVSLLANLFQRGLCLDMIDIDGKQDSPDISDEERISFKAADEALSRVDLDELFDNAEILEIPDKYPEFYEYLRELQLERQEDGHGERTIEDVSADGQYAVRVSAPVGTDDVLLFVLSVGENGSGYALGSAPDASGAQTAIWLDIHEIPKDAAWTADEYAHINALQSFVNDLIEQINHLEGFQGGAG